MKGVQFYELFGGIALKNHAFSFSKNFSIVMILSFVESFVCSRFGKII